MVWYVLVDISPALQRIHQFPRGLQTSSHLQRLLSDDLKGILKQSGLVLCRRRRGHAGVVAVVQFGGSGDEAERRAFEQ